MANANIVHSGYGFRCTVTEQNLPLTLVSTAARCWSG